MVLKQIKKEKEAYGRSTIDSRAFVILDDCLYDQFMDYVIKLMRLIIYEWKTLENYVNYYYAIPFRGSTKFKN